MHEGGSARGAAGARGNAGQATEDAAAVAAGAGRVAQSVPSGNGNEFEMEIECMATWVMRRLWLSHGVGRVPGGADVAGEAEAVEGVEEGAAAVGGESESESEVAAGVEP